MSFCALNGLDIPIAHEQSEHAVEQIGESARAYSATWRDTVRYNKRSWKLSTPIISIADAEQIEGLLRGDGWHFDFESDTYACIKGLAPNTGYTGVTISNTQYKIGSYTMKIASAGTIIWPCELSSKDWSLLFWHYYSAWQWCAIIYDVDTNTLTEYLANAGNSWVPTSGAAIGCYTVYANGNVELQGRDLEGTAYDVYYDDLVVVPYKMTITMLTACVNSGSGREFSDLPRLNLSGDLVKTTSTIAVRGRLEQARHTQAVLSGAWSDQARSVAFTLYEV